jgi:four helix bundle protein
MAIASKEARETRYRLRLLDRSSLIDMSLKKYLDDIEEIIRMLTKIVKTTYENLTKKQ